MYELMDQILNPLFDCPIAFGGQPNQSYTIRYRTTGIPLTTGENHMSNTNRKTGEGARESRPEEIKRFCELPCYGSAILLRIRSGNLRCDHSTHESPDGVCEDVILPFVPYFQSRSFLDQRKVGMLQHL